MRQTSEATPAQVQTAPGASAVRTVDAVKIYGHGETAVRALDGISVDMARGHFTAMVNTMALSIVERVRELGLVRALGMTRGQTRSMVRWETVLITVFGAILGCAVGIFFGVSLVRAFASQGVDVLNLSIGRQITYVIVAFFAGLLAAIWPARRAARVDLLQAIATE
jgi:ABC-type lipoprotein release transport system permease subunit